MNPFSAIYGQVARFRRQWYEQHPHRQRQLGCPVISVGNLVMGGSSKTPVVALLATLLRDDGYRPAILSRGYKRLSTDAVVIVSDGRGSMATVDQSGDEPQLLARRLPDVSIVVSADRHRAGILARERFGANVLILDDGFQHVRVARTLNLLLVSEDDLHERVFPAGRLREPLAAAHRADALLITGGAERSRIGQALGVGQTFTVTTAYEPIRRVLPFGDEVPQQPRRVVTVAAIARPERFVHSVRTLGYEVIQEFTFRDHHWFSVADVRRIEEAARATNADAILTTEKDAVRLERVMRDAAPIMFLPIGTQVEPADEFRNWVLQRIGPPGQAP